MDVGDGEQPVGGCGIAQALGDGLFRFEEVKGVVAEHEAMLPAGDRPGRTSIEADQLDVWPDDPMPGQPELGEDHVASGAGYAAPCQFAQVGAGAAGEFEDAVGFGPMRLEQGKAGEIGPVAPAVGEVVADAAEAKMVHRLAERQRRAFAYQRGDAHGVCRRAAPPVVLLHKQQREGSVSLACIEAREHVDDEFVTSGAKKGDAVDHRPAFAVRGKGMRRVRREGPPRERRAQRLAHGSPTSASTRS